MRAQGRAHAIVSGGWLKLSNERVDIIVYVPAYLPRDIVYQCQMYINKRRRKTKNINQRNNERTAKSKIHAGNISYRYKCVYTISITCSSIAHIIILYYTHKKHWQWIPCISWARGGSRSSLCVWCVRALKAVVVCHFPFQFFHVPSFLWIAFLSLAISLFA